MSGKKYKLDFEDIAILNKAKKEISIAVDLLQQNGIRNVNIEIELVTHVKNSIKGEVIQWDY